ncbi:MAG: folylpolyglutamate synthase/dihydrofolate synthase family protein [Candidatus Thermoplasmatota archaeon]|nr:folylpolyglutamate synthase/dihydrofolate synthase family protein [Candidatus Thermoplasmatota archaeon]
MDYSAIINYLYGLQRFGTKLGLRNIRTLARLLNNPHHALRAVHITGTNGKGSVAAMIASVLQAQGYKVGLYTSPHLSRFTERITINGKEIPESKVVELTKELKLLADKTKAITSGYPTFFEFTTALMFKYFCDEKIDIASIEVGMGGRLDATNIINPLVSVITTVALEHTKYLGNTIEKIAYEKCGIIKRKRPVVTAVNNTKALGVIKNLCRKRCCELFVVGNDIEFKVLNQSLQNQELEVCGLLDSYKISIPLLGTHQCINAATAIATLECLKKYYGIAITKESIKKGLGTVRWHGRLEIVKKKPLVLLDCSHNPEAARTLAKELEKFKALKILVIGISSDKDISSVLRELLPQFELVIATQSKVIERALPVEELTRKILEHKNKVIVARNVNKAIDCALSLASKNDIICITGSVFVVGEARDYLVESRKSKDN